MLTGQPEQAAPGCFRFRARLTRWCFRRLGGKYAASWLSEILSGSLPVNPEASHYLEAPASGDPPTPDDPDALRGMNRHQQEFEFWKAAPTPHWPDIRLLDLASEISSDPASRRRPCLD